MIGDLGDFDEISSAVDSVGILYCFFFLATILLTITMLNLLIAIISDTFSRVKNAEDLTKIWERWNIITEIDDMLHTKNKRKNITDSQDKKFLMFIYNDCHFKKQTTEVDFKNSIQELKTKQEEFRVKAEQNFQKMEEFKTNTEKELKNLKETMDTNSGNSDKNFQKME